MSPAVAILTDGYGPNAVVVFVYDPALVAVIRRAPRRRWDKQGRRWWIPIGDVALVADSYTDAGFDVYVDGEPWRRPPPAPVPSDPIAALLDVVPDRLRSKTIRALSLVFHPDVGGDGRLMQRLNDAVRDRARSARSTSPPR